MAFLRFSRDTRGYESTFLLQNVREQGKIRSRVLYWFRTPPNVKVGRAVLDEEAIRLIEEANPDIDIDWTKVLKAKPLPPVDDGDGRKRRRTRDRSDAVASPSGARRRRSAGRSRTDVRPPDQTERVDEVAVAEAAVAQDANGDQDGREGEDVAVVRSHPVEGIVGAEGHARLQAQYAELLARISARVTDVDRRAQLRAEAATLDPESWVTVEDARAAVETFDARIHEFRSKLGRRARRSRRGGRGRRGKGFASAAGTGAAATAADIATTQAPDDGE